MSKSPYELRFDTLMLAQQHLVHEYQSALERANLAPDDMRQGMIAALKFPTLDDVQRAANSLRGFIDADRAEGRATLMEGRGEREWIPEEHHRVHRGRNRFGNRD